MAEATMIFDGDPADWPLGDNIAPDPATVEWIESNDQPVAEKQYLDVWSWDFLWLNASTTGAGVLNQVDNANTELATSVDWGKSAIRDIADEGKQIVLTAMDQTGNIITGVAAAATGAGAVLLIGGILLALWLLKNPQVVSNAARKAATAGGV